MSKTPVRKKLTLQRETIRSLDAVELDDVNGGTLAPIVTASIRFCRYTPPAARSIIAASNAVSWAVKHPPKGNPDNPPSFVTATA